MNGNSRYTSKKRNFLLMSVHSKTYVDIMARAASGQLIWEPEPNSRYIGRWHTDAGPVRAEFTNALVRKRLLEIPPGQPDRGHVLMPTDEGLKMLAGAQGVVLADTEEAPPPAVPPVNLGELADALTTTEAFLLVKGIVDRIDENDEPQAVGRLLGKRLVRAYEQTADLAHYPLSELGLQIGGYLIDHGLITCPYPCLARPSVITSTGRPVCPEHADADPS